MTETTEKQEVSPRPMADPGGINWQAEYLAQINTRLGSLETGLADLRHELRSLAARLDSKMETIRGELRGEIAQLRDALHRDVRLVMLGVAASILTTIVTGVLRPFL